MHRRLFALTSLLLCVSVAGALAQSAPPSQQLPVSQLPRFAVTLALGETTAGQTTGFSPAATRALADMKGFLPYLRYTHLDTVYLIGLGGPNQRLRGADGQQYELIMRGTRTGESVTNVELLRLFGVPSMERKYAGGIVMEASFKINVGETVVVGTSRLDGERALILLVTAAR